MSGVVGYMGDGMDVSDIRVVQCRCVAELEGLESVVDVMRHGRGDYGGERRAF